MLFHHRRNRSQNRASSEEYELRVASYALIARQDTLHALRIVPAIEIIEPMINHVCWHKMNNPSARANGTAASASRQDEAAYIEP
jgi:hypothetical protein